jgi:hypothetical protein
LLLELEWPIYRFNRSSDALMFPLVKVGVLFPNRSPCTMIWRLTSKRATEQPAVEFNWQKKGIFENCHY